MNKKRGGFLEAAPSVYGRKYNFIADKKESGIIEKWGRKPRKT